MYQARSEFRRRAGTGGRKEWNPRRRPREERRCEKISCRCLRRDWAAANSPVDSGRTRGRRHDALAKQNGLIEAPRSQPILRDVFDKEALIKAVGDFKPDVVLNELTDLPDDAAQISERADLNARIRTEGTRNLIEAARRSGSPKILAQSVAWQLPDGPDAQAVAELERSVLAECGVVLRYGQFYGPGTYNRQQLPKEPRVHIDRAAERTVAALGEPPGVVVVID